MLIDKAELHVLPWPSLYLWPSPRALFRIVVAAVRAAWRPPAPAAGRLKLKRFNRPLLPRGGYGRFRLVFCSLSELFPWSYIVERGFDDLVRPHDPPF